MAIINNSSAPWQRNKLYINLDLENLIYINSSEGEMKSSRLNLIPFLIILFLITIPLTAQELQLQKYIGKPLNEVIKDFGKPVHKDYSNENMKCIFYKSKTNQYVFVAGPEGVFQAEGTAAFNSKNAAISKMNQFVNDCIERGLKPDTLGVTHYSIRCKGAEVDLTLFENTYSHRYEVKVKVDKRED